MKKITLFVVLHLFFQLCGAQHLQRIPYSTLDTVGWLQGSYELIVLDTNNQDLISLIVDQETSTVTLRHTQYWPEAYSCFHGDIEIEEDYKFKQPIVKYQPVLKKAKGTTDEIIFIFQVKREGTIFDYTGVVALRHFFPRRELLSFVYNQAD
jgi:hypothetical protein